jgi:hypothetical protein
LFQLVTVVLFQIHFGSGAAWTWDDFQRIRQKISGVGEGAGGCFFFGARMSLLDILEEMSSFSFKKINVQQ